MCFSDYLSIDLPAATGGLAATVLDYDDDLSIILFQFGYLPENIAYTV
ncbi:MAG: hypothetical protein GWO38_11880 [Phycisphaerae bacterium]|nr:hypothetical protein [Phycisphaerae bacterium]NIP50474.1 hypothetical protein [Phycisphaerae bacterium]NIX28303.1 hypothetical protein [Phycisphaerae bacterium]